MIATLLEERELPAHEWERLRGTELETLWPKLTPSTDRVIVVERDGEIVACWALMQMLHVEGLWITPGERKQAVVARRLWRAMRAAVADYHAAYVWTGADTDEIREMITTAGGTKVPFDSYVLPMGEIE